VLFGQNCNRNSAYAEPSKTFRFIKKGMVIFMNISVITGASSGLGREFAVQLDGYGLDELWLIARREDRLNELKEKLNTKVRIITIDLFNDSWRAELKIILEQEKPVVRYLINSAGIGIYGRYDEISEADNDKMIDLNIKALVAMTVIILPYMNKGSHILEIASCAGFVPVPFENVYAATKAFVISYSRALKYELNSKGISVTAICPGKIDTEFFEHTGNAKHKPEKKGYIVSAKAVVRHTLKTACRGKQTTVYGMPIKLYQYIGKFLSHDLIIKFMTKFNREIMK